MAPIKFEEQLKDKLEKRTLSPASDSWSKLSERLDADNKKSKSSVFSWLSIAAGILIMIAISVQFFSSESREKMLPRVVKENLKEEPSIENSKKQNTENVIKLAEENSVKMQNDKKATSTKIQISTNNKSTEPKLQLAENNKDFKKTDATILKEDSKKFMLSESQEAVIKNAVAEAWNQVKNEGNSVLDREVDSLLKMASKELFKEKLSKEATVTVDAQLLLMSVQDDMGQSFRSKVFEALKDSYNTVKTAVAERNN